MFQKDTGSSLKACVVCGSLLLTACGGGGGHDPEAAREGILKAGLYETQVNYADGRESTAATFLTPSGRIASRFGLEELSFGQLEVDGADIDGTTEDYFNPATDNPDFYLSKQSSGSLSGTVLADGVARLETTNSKGEVNAVIRLTRFNSLSDLGLSLEDAAGSYMKDDSSLTITVDPGGALFAQFPDPEKDGSCTLEGNLSVPDASINLFEIDFTLSGCDEIERRGDYTGLGNFGPTDGGQLMIFFAQNGFVGLRFEGTR